MLHWRLKRGSGICLLRKLLFRLTPSQVLMAFERVSEFPIEEVSQLDLSPISLAVRRNCVHFAAMQFSQALRASQKLHLKDPLFHVSLFTQIGSPNRFLDVSEQLFVLEALVDYPAADKQLLLFLVRRVSAHIAALTPEQVVTATIAFAKVKVSDHMAHMALGYLPCCL